MRWNEAIDCMRAGKWVRRESWDTTWMIRIDETVTERVKLLLMPGTLGVPDYSDNKIGAGEIALALLLNDTFADDWEDMG